MSDKAKRLESLAHRLAYVCARGDISSYCLGHMTKDKQWFETELPADERFREVTQAQVNTAIEYLELRGLIERHSKKPWVAIRSLA